MDDHIIIGITHIMRFDFISLKVSWISSIGVLCFSFVSFSGESGYSLSERAFFGVLSVKRINEPAVAKILKIKNKFDFFMFVFRTIAAMTFPMIMELI